MAHKNTEANLQKKYFINSMTKSNRIRVLIRIFLSIFKNLTNLKLLFKKIYYLLYSLDSHNDFRKFEFYYSEETITLLLNSEKSFIRWGDGETFLTMGQDIVFQEYDVDLANELNSILINYNNESNYYLALPLTPLILNNFDLIRSGFFIFWYKTRYLIKNTLKGKSLIILDAFSFRPMGVVTKKRIELLWYEKNVVFIHNDIGVFNDFCINYSGINAQFIKITSQNAFSHKNEIIAEILTSIQKLEKLNSHRKTVVLISAGPTAKSIILNLSQNSIVCYDMGHFFEWKFYDEKVTGVI